MSDMVSYVVAEKNSSGGGDDDDSDNIYSRKSKQEVKFVKMAPSMEKFWN